MRSVIVRAAPWLFAAGLLPADPQDETRTRNTVILRKYSDPTDLTRRARDYASEKRYDDALAIYTRAIQGFGEHVLEISPNCFQGVRDYCLRQLSAWPPEGRKAYRTRFDAEARERYERARARGDEPGLASVAAVYPFSAAAAEATAYLANLHLENGRFAAAAEAVESFLALNDADADAFLLALAARAYAAEGETAKLEALIHRFSERFGKAEVLQGDARLSLAEYWDGQVQRASQVRRRPPPPQASDPAWPMFGGDAASTRPARPDVDAVRRVWSTTLPDANYTNTYRSGNYDWDNDRIAPAQERYHPVFPAAVDGTVYACNGLALRAYNLFSSKAEPLWSFEQNRPSGDLMFEERLVHATTYADGRVFASLVTGILGSENKMGYLQVKYPFPKRALYAFDAQSGKLLWKLGGVRTEKPIEGTFSFSAAPTAEGGKLYVGAVRQQLSEEPAEHYVLCLNPANGEVLWKSYIATGGTEINLFGNSIRESTSSKVSVMGERVFYTTNHGAIACLERSTGSVLWINKYEQLPVRPTRIFPPPRNGLLWINNPIVATPSALVVTPTDSPALLALDPANGRVLYTIDFADHETSQVLGVRGDALVLSGADVRIYSLRTGKAQDVLKPSLGSGAGHGTLSASRIYFPTTKGLCVFDLDRRQEIQFIRWDDLSGGGNVTVAENTVIVTAGETTLQIFAEEFKESDIARQLAESPQDIAVAYRAGLKYLQLQKIDEALAAFQRVVQLGPKTTHPDAARIVSSAKRRLFLTYRRLGEQERGRDGLDRALEHYRRAAEYALSAREETELAFSMSEIYVRKKDFVRQIEVLQRLIETTPDLIFRDRKVFELAREEIDAAIRTAGPEVYAAFESRARTLFEAARRSGSVDELTAVYRRYPNSSPASEAIFLAAKLLVESNGAAEAHAWLRLLQREYPDFRERVQADVLIVQSLEKRRLFGSARRVLGRMLKNQPDAAIQVDGRSTTVAEFAKGRMAMADYQKVAAPEGSRAPNMPLRKSFEYKDDALLLNLLPAEGVAQGRAQDLLPISVKGHVRLLDVKTGLRAASWPVPAPPQSFAWFGEILIVRGEQYVLGFDVAQNKEIWRYTPEMPIVLAKLADEFYVLAGGAPLQQGIAVTSIAALSLSTGEVMWRREVPGICQSITPVDESLVLKGSAPERLFQLEIETGNPTGGRSLDPTSLNFKYQVIYAAADSLVLLGTQWSRGRLVCLNAPSLEPKWDKLLEAPDVRVTANAAWTVAAQSMPGRIDFVNMKTGKLAKRIDADLSRGVTPILDGDRLYVIDGDALKAFELDRLLWAAELGKGGLKDRAVIPAGDTLILWEGLYSDTGKFGYTLQILDRSAKIMKIINGEPKYQTPCMFMVANGMIVVGVESVVEVYR